MRLSTYSSVIPGPRQSSLRNALEYFSPTARLCAYDWPRLESLKRQVPSHT